MDKILVTGGCGFIGSNLVRYLLDKNYRVGVLDDLRTSSRSNIDGLKVSLTVEDISQRVPYGAIWADAIVHLAASTSVIESNLNPAETWHNNVDGIFNVLEFCRQNCIKRLVFASSAAVEGDSVYGATKKVGEILCKSYRRYGIETVCLRFSNVYGKFSNNEGVISKFVENIRQDKPIVVYGDGNQTRDFVNVQDICQAIELSLRAKPGGYEIGTGKETSINDLICILQKITGKSISIDYQPARGVEILHSVADISKAQSELGYVPCVELEQGIGELWQKEG